MTELSGKQIQSIDVESDKLAQEFAFALNDILYGPRDPYWTPERAEQEELRHARLGIESEIYGIDPKKAADMLRDVIADLENKPRTGEA